MSALSSSPFPELGPNTPPAIQPACLPTPTFGPGGSFTVACSAFMPASPAACLAAMLTPSTWAQWNTFVPRASITERPSPPPSLPKDLSVLLTGREDILVPGVRVSFEVHMDLNETATRQQPVLVTHLEQFERGGRTGLRVAWKAEGFPEFILRSERVQEFVAAEGGGCEYYCWETFCGPLAPVVRLAVGKKLEAAFGAWMNGLKKYVGDGTEGAETKIA